MITDLLQDIIQNSAYNKDKDCVSEQAFIENILQHIYQFLYRNGRPVHTVGMGILRGNTFDMYYEGRLLEKFTKSFGAMSYETTMAGMACDLFLTEKKPFLNLYSKDVIKKMFEKTSTNLEQLSFHDEAKALRNRLEITIDQGIRSFLYMPLTFCGKIIGIFTISSVKESDPSHMVGEDIESDLIPVAQMLSLMIYMEKISYDKANDMGRLLISSVDAKDEYQASHSLNVKTMIDFFIDELSRDRALRQRVENIGLFLTVDRIQRLRLAALLHDIGKIFIPGSILRKSDLTEDEILIRKMHSYCTYNILSKSETLKDLADIASMHHAFYYLPMDNSGLDEYSQIETDVVGYPFDRVSEQNFLPETQVIALADVLNAIVRTRPNGKGLDLSKALDIIENEEFKFHEGLKDVFLTVVKRVEKNLSQGKYLPGQAEEYRSCLWLEDENEHDNSLSSVWSELHEFLNEIKFNMMGIVTIIRASDMPFSENEKINIGNKPIYITTVNDEYLVLSLRGIPKEEGFIWVHKIFNYFRDQSFNGKMSFSFISKSGCVIDLQDLYDTLIKGLESIDQEPVDYYLNPSICSCDAGS